MTMNIFLTGATGFLGQHLLNSFVQQGYQVLISCRNRGKLPILSAKSMQQISVWYINESNLDEIIGSYSKIDVIIHAATDYGRDQCQPTHVFWANEAFPMTLLEKAMQYGISTFINVDTFFNTSASQYEYLSAYTLSKRHFQEWVQYCGLQHRLNVINLKLFHLFGPNDDIQKYVPMMISRCLKGETIDHTEGTQQRDFIHVDDVVDAVNAVIHADLPYGYHHYEVGRGEPVLLRDFAELINLLCGKKAILNFGALPMRQGELMQVCADISSLNSLGWMPRVSLQAGLTSIIEGEQSSHR